MNATLSPAFIPPVAGPPCRRCGNDSTVIHSVNVGGEPCKFGICPKCKKRVAVVMPEAAAGMMMFNSLVLGQESATDADAEYRQEYREAKAAYPQMMASEAEYIRSRRIDDGLESLPFPQVSSR